MVSMVAQIAAGVALTGLGTAVGWLVRTVGVNQRRCDVLEAALAALKAEVDAAATKAADVDGRLDEHGERLAKVEVTTGAIKEIRDDIRAVHARIDGVSATTNELKGALNALSATNASILEALVPQRAAA